MDPRTVLGDQRGIELQPVACVLDRAPAEQPFHRVGHLLRFLGHAERLRMCRTKRQQRANRQGACRNARRAQQPERVAAHEIGRRPTQ